MTEEDIIARGFRARALLNDDDIKQAFEDLDRELYWEWKMARTEDQRESLHATQRALERISMRLHSWADELTRRNID